MAKSASGTEIVGKLRQADVLLAQGKTGTEYLYGHDHLYSPAVLFGSSGTVSGTVAVRYEYDAYGRRRQYTAGWVPSSLQIWGNYYAFTGRELDYLDGGNLQVMYYRARYYDTDTGRFLQRDPLGIDPAGDAVNSFNPTRQYEDGMNGYEYGQSNPVLNRDLWGLASEVPRQVCCKIKRKEIVPVVNYYTNTVWPGIRTICTQETISSRGASPGVACQCRYKNQKNVTVYGWHSGECCWCDIYQYRFPGGFLGLPSHAHQAINIVCEQGRDSWSADVWPESQDGITPFIPHRVKVKVGGALNGSADGGHGLYLGRMSCDAADLWKNTLSQAEWLYQFPFSECRDFVRRFGNEMSETCP